MQKAFLLAAGSGIALLTWMTGCLSPAWTQAKVEVKWAWAEIVKDDKGQIEETGNKGSDGSSPSHVGLKVGLNDKTIEVIDISHSKVKFRVTDKSWAKQEADVEAGSSTDVWLKNNKSGIRISVETITPIQE